MTSTVKLLFDLCFYYTLSGYFLRLVTVSQPLIWGIPLIIAVNIVYLILKLTGLKSERYKKQISMPLKIICSALPGLFALLHPAVGQIVQFLPAWAYFCFLIWSERTAVDYAEFKEHFAFTGKLYFLLFFGLIFVIRIPAALRAVVPYFALYILSGIFLMRVLRAEGKLSSVRSAAILLSVLAAAVLITVFRAQNLFVAAIGYLYKYVIAWILGGLAVIIAGIGYALYYLFKAAFSLFRGEPVQIDVDIEGIAQEIIGEEIMQSQGASLGWLKAVLLALAALAVVLIVFLIFRSLLGDKQSSKKESAYQVGQERLEKMSYKKSAAMFRPKEPRLAVRWYYRKYLKEGVSRGALLLPSDTSERVLIKYESLFEGDSSAGLREAYIKARYSQREQVTGGDVAQVQELWKNLKG